LRCITLRCVALGLLENTHHWCIPSYCSGTRCGRRSAYSFPRQTNHPYSHVCRHIVEICRCTDLRVDTGTSCLQGMLCKMNQSIISRAKPALKNPCQARFFWKKFLDLYTMHKKTGYKMTTQEEHPTHHSPRRIFYHKLQQVY